MKFITIFINGKSLLVIVGSVGQFICLLDFCSHLRLPELLPELLMPTHTTQIDEKTVKIT